MESLSSCLLSKNINDIFALLGYYAALSGSNVPTFWENLSVPSSCPLKMGATRPETSVRNYHSMLRNIQEGRRFDLHRGDSLKSRKKNKDLNIHSCYTVSCFIWVSILVCQIKEKQRLRVSANRVLRKTWA
jgi:hypothetical protein